MGDMDGINFNDQPTLDAPTKPNYKDAVMEVERIFSRFRIADKPGWFAGYLLEPESPFEKPNLRSVGGKDNASRWEYPYLLRVKGCAVQWVRMTPADRDIIKAGREDGVHWRGEDVDHFMVVYRETEKMRKDPKAYINNMKQMAREFSLGAN